MTYMTIRSMTIGVKRKTYKLDFSHNAAEVKPAVKACRDLAILAHS
jgi:hypothetical protein